MIVVDASALVSLLLDRGSAGELEACFRKTEEVILAPHLIDVEILQALRRLSRLSDISVVRAQTAIEQLALLPIERVPHVSLSRRVWELRDNLSAYDAVYVALAELYTAVLMTCDARLSRASGHKAQIRLIQ